MHRPFDPSAEANHSPGWRRFSALLVAVAASGVLGDRPATADEPYGRFQFDPAEREHWAFQGVKRPVPPAVTDTSRVRNPIDTFILAALEEAGLQPAPTADRRTLLRRLYLDLKGLAPTPEEQQDFLTDDSPDAVARLVDDLLSRPEYGERWARHWLDVVRYAESNGYERDGTKPSVWRYRDYVINAFNADKPYDQFIREQLAGDELQESNAETQIATTFLRLGTWDDEPADPEVDRYDQLDDLIGATTATFLAQTVRCARCHDHKFESFTQRDYSRLLAVFEPLKRPQDGRTDLDRPVGTREELAVYEQATKRVDEQVAALRTQADEQQASVCRRLVEAGALTGEPAAPAAATDGQAKPADDAAPQPLPDDALAAVLTPTASRSTEQQKLVEKYRSRLGRMLERMATPEEKASLDALRRQIEAAEAQRPPAPIKAYIWYEDGSAPPATHVFRRGNPRDKLDEVGPGVPAILVEGPLAPPTPSEHGSGRRRQLADWIANPANPLTARVLVNRIWQHHFGNGLVGSENDFGVMGESPSHPELLDWLADEFLRGGWSIKQLHRLIVLSGTYQQSAVAGDEVQQRDLHNALLSRYPSRRLEAEAVRDNVLAASGQLNRRPGGQSVYPNISPAVLASQSRPGNGWGKSDAAEAARRSVYVFVKRTLLVPELEVLDFPDTNGTCEQRQVSTVAPQALTMLNGEFMQEQARHFARRLETEAPDLNGQIERAYLLALSRRPGDAERAAVLDFLTRQERQIRADDEAAGKTSENSAQRALAAFCLVLLNTNEFVYLP